MGCFSEWLGKILNIGHKYIYILYIYYIYILYIYIIYIIYIYIILYIIYILYIYIYMRVDCDVVYPRVFFELIDRDLLVAPAAAQSFSRCSERRAVGLSHIGQLEYLLHHGMTGHDALHCRLHAFHTPHALLTPVVTDLSSTEGARHRSKRLFSKLGRYDSTVRPPTLQSCTLKCCARDCVLVVSDLTSTFHALVRIKATVMPLPQFIRLLNILLHGISSSPTCIRIYELVRHSEASQ